MFETIPEHVVGLGGRPRKGCCANSVEASTTAVCEQVRCGLPPDLSHARPSNIAQKTFAPGMSVRYECDTGYAGNPEQVCQADGRWSGTGDSTQCEMIGCGPLKVWLQDNFGDSWSSVMQLQQWHSESYSFAGQVVPFQCSRGYQGKPIAVCMKERACFVGAHGFVPELGVSGRLFPGSLGKRPVDLGRERLQPGRGFRGASQCARSGTGQLGRGHDRLWTRQIDIVAVASRIQIRGGLVKGLRCFGRCVSDIVAGRPSRPEVVSGPSSHCSPESRQSMELPSTLR